jgi:hypothetical protein
MPLASNLILSYRNLLATLRHSQLYLIIWSSFYILLKNFLHKIITYRLIRTLIDEKEKDFSPKRCIFRCSANSSHRPHTMKQKAIRCENQRNVLLIYTILWYCIIDSFFTWSITCFAIHFYRYCNWTSNRIHLYNAKFLFTTFHYMIGRI